MPHFDGNGLQILDSSDRDFSRFIGKAVNFSFTDDFLRLVGPDGKNYVIEKPSHPKQNDGKIYSEGIALYGYLSGENKKLLFVDLLKRGISGLSSIDAILLDGEDVLLSPSEVHEGKHPSSGVYPVESLQDAFFWLVGVQIPRDPKKTRLDMDSEGYSAILRKEFVEEMRALY